LLVSSLSVVAFAIVLPLTPIGDLFEFQDPSILFFVFLAAFVAAYLTMVETLKRVFYKRYAHRLEQIVIPQKGPPYPTPTAKLVQNIIAIIGLRLEDEVSTDSLLSDLREIATYPVDSDQFVHGLHHVRRAGLVEIDWRKGIIRRQPALTDYVGKLPKREDWPKVAEDWRRIASFIRTRYSKVNTEYQKLVE
jgi:hypothetical protein